MSRVLHGPVQDAITSTLVRLQSSGTQLQDPKLAADLRARISSSLDLLSAPAYPDTDLRLLLDDLEELWSDTVTIHTECSDEDFELLHEHQTAAYTVSEVLREACSNAIRHGNAKHVSIRLDIAEDSRLVEIVVENDGAKLNPNAKLGLGSHLFDEVSLGWSRDQVGNLVRLTVRIPLS